MAGTGPAMTRRAHRIQLRVVDVDQRSAAVRRLNVTVEMNTTAVPVNRCVDMPRCGSFFPNVIITDDAGFCRYGLSVRKSVVPRSDVLMKAPALGATIMARIHGSLNC